jgi:sulfur carrier protein
VKVFINGEDADVRGAKTITELVERLELSAKTILIEHNGVALHRREWPETVLADGDRVEFLSVVAGG